MTDIDTTAGQEVDDDVESVNRVVRRVVTNVEDVIVGHRPAIEHLVTALLGRGHVLLEDVPGVGKTMLARAVATSIEGEFTRIQFTPDLLPTDVTGVDVFDQRDATFDFRAGPIFGNVVLGDEINRAPPKTQSALLEAMEEGQVTVDGETHALPDPFTVIATQNTVEGDRTYELPMAERDRFMKRLRLGYPDVAEEKEVLDRVVGHHPIDDVAPVTSLEEIRHARDVTADVTIEEPLRDYVARLAADTREHARLGVSPRGAIALLQAAQGRAVLNGRGYVVPDDVRTEAPAVLPHRIRTDDPDRSGEDVLERALERVPVE